MRLVDIAYSFQYGVIITYAHTAPAVRSVVRRPAPEYTITHASGMIGMECSMRSLRRNLIWKENRKSDAQRSAYPDASNLAPAGAAGAWRRTRRRLVATD